MPKAGQNLPFNNRKLLKMRARLVEQPSKNPAGIGTLNRTPPTDPRFSASDAEGRGTGQGFPSAPSARPLTEPLARMRKTDPLSNDGTLSKPGNIG